ncbi:MAG: hypothetical protein OYG31_02650 [Candidatus Kaiserbacteria bacterium]|nr:hypothetical protein [Candidatus Kaiserbacteria bacterium]
MSYLKVVGVFLVGCAVGFSVTALLSSAVEALNEALFLAESAAFFWSVS